MIQNEPYISKRRAAAEVLSAAGHRRVLRLKHDKVLKSPGKFSMAWTKLFDEC